MIRVPPEHSRWPSSNQQLVVTTALIAAWPDLGEDPVYVDQLAAVALDAVDATKAGRCILRHPWNRWRLISQTSGLGTSRREWQQRECLRCGRIQRASLAEA